MSGNIFYIEVICDDRSRARIRADEITTVLERNVNGVALATIPTKVKTLQTMHTMDQIWTELEAALGGLKVRVHRPPEAFAPAPPKAESKSKSKAA